MIKLHKMYQIKPRCLKWTRDHADQLHVRDGKLETDREYKISKLSKVGYAIPVDVSDVMTNVYLCLIATDIGITSYYIDGSDLIVPRGSR